MPVMMQPRNKHGMVMVPTNADRVSDCRIAGMVWAVFLVFTLGMPAAYTQTTAPAVDVPAENTLMPSLPETPKDATPAVVAPKEEANPIDIPPVTAVSTAAPVPVGHEDAIPKSLFLSPEDYTHISKAITDYQDRKNHKGGQSGDEQESKKEKGNERYFTYPQFFMESLVYHSPGDWFVRVNGQSITPQTSPESLALTIVGIDNEKVLFRWKPVDFSRVLQVWDKRPASKDMLKLDANDKPIEMQFNGKVLETVPDVPVNVDKDEKLVTFNLRPNQTFSSFVMQILEGKVVPVTVDYFPNSGAHKQEPILPKAKAPPAPAQKPKAPSAAPPKAVPAPQAKTPPAPPGKILPPVSPGNNAVDDSNSGLNGLMNAINKKDTGQIQ